MKYTRLFFYLCACMFLATSCQSRNVATDTDNKSADEPIICGGDSDEHGCVPSAGYIWSEAKQKCIRPWEEGIRMASLSGDSVKPSFEGATDAFIVFSEDSSTVDFIAPKETRLLNRRSLPAGGQVWNVEDDDTPNLRLIDSVWVISKRGKEIYRQK